MQNLIVIKIGGHELNDAQFLEQLIGFLRRCEQPVIVVHGGGKEISQLQQQLNITPQYHDGVRITDADSLAIVEMVLCGTVNKRLVRLCVNEGVPAIGLSGVDFGLIRAVKMPDPVLDMQYTGTVETVDVTRLRQLIEIGLVPVIAPICLGTDSNFNVNADHVAGAIAGAMGADRVVFVTNVAGVMHDGVVLPQLSPQDVQQLIADEIITGGMIPKVQTALKALGYGVQRAVITNITGLYADQGTTFTSAITD